MRNCSHFEHLFDGYLEGTLSAVVRVRTERHLAECAPCREFLAELRLIDGMLVTTTQIDPAANFTFAVMAEVRSLPVPRPPRSRVPLFLLVYVALAWAALGAWMATGHGSAQIASATFASLRHVLSVGMAGLITASHVAAHQPTGIIWLVGVLLVLDITIACAALTFYVAVRPRLVAHLSRPEIA